MSAKADCLSIFLSTFIVSKIYGPFKIASTLANLSLLIFAETILSNTSLLILKPDFKIKVLSVPLRSSLVYFPINSSSETITLSKPFSFIF